MTSYTDIETQALTQLDGIDFAGEDAPKILKSLQMLKNLQPEPEPTPEPEPNWFSKHSETLIKSGGALLSVLAIVAFESLANGMFRSQATKFIK